MNIAAFKIVFWVGDDDKDTGQYFDIDLYDGTAPPRSHLARVDRCGERHEWDRSGGRNPGECYGGLNQPVEKQRTWELVLQPRKLGGGGFNASRIEVLMGENLNNLTNVYTHGPHRFERDKPLNIQF